MGRVALQPVDMFYFCTTMLLIDGLYVNKGGGGVLLQYLIEQIMLHPRKDEVFYLFDSRFDIPKVLTKNYKVVDPSLKNRSRFYRETGKNYSKIFCFANTPPPKRFNVPVYTYSHNQKLLEAHRQKFKPAYRQMYLKYLFIKLYNKNTDYYVVQTPHMVAELLNLKLKPASHCLTIPFYDTGKYAGEHTPFNERPEDGFVFVSTPSPQKNYPTLLDAWEHLHSMGHTPGLHITIDNTAPHLLARIAQLQAKGVKVYNYNYIDPRELYFKHRYLVCSSTMESFGLPLIESIESGMKVLAPDMEYVYDVIKPSLVFDPWKKESIAEAVLKALSTELPFPEIKAKNEVKELIRLLLG